MKDAKKVRVPEIHSIAGKTLKKPVLLQEKTRTALYLIFFLCFLGSLVSLVFMLIPKKSETQKDLFSYTMMADISCEAKLVPNPLYPEGKLEEERLIPSKLLDVLVLECSVLWEGAAEAEISGHYEVSLVAQGYQLEGEQKSVVYERRTSLAKGEIIQEESSRAELKLPVSFSPAQYQPFFSEAEILIDSRPTKELQLIFEGTVFADTAHGQVESPFSQTLTVPVGSNLFKVIKSAPLSESDAIRETVSAETAQSLPHILIPAVAAALFLLAILFLLFFVRVPDAWEQYRLLAGKLEKKYGSRMIKMQDPPQRETERDVALRGIFDLVKLADEAGRPICYCPSEDGCPQNGIYYVQDKDTRYLWVLRPDKEEF